MHPPPHSPPPSPASPVIGMQPLFPTMDATWMLFGFLALHSAILYCLILTLFGQEKQRFENTVAKTLAKTTSSKDEASEAMMKKYKFYLTHGRTRRRASLAILFVSSLIYLFYSLSLHTNVLTPKYVAAIAAGDTSYLSDESRVPLMLYIVFVTGLPVAFCFAANGSIMISRSMEIGKSLGIPVNSDEYALWSQMTNMATNRLGFSSFFIVALTLCYDVRFFGYSQVLGSTLLTVSYFVDLVLCVFYADVFKDQTFILSKILQLFGWLLLWVVITQAFGARYHPFGKIKDDNVFENGVAKPDGEDGALDGILLILRVAGSICLSIGYGLGAFGIENMGQDAEGKTVSNITVGAKGATDVKNSLLHSSA